MDRLEAIERELMGREKAPAVNPRLSAIENALMGEGAPQAAPAARGRVSSPLPSEPSPPLTEEQLKTMEYEGIPVTGKRPIEKRGPLMAEGPQLEGVAALPGDILETGFHLAKGAVGYVPATAEEFVRLGIGTAKGMSPAELEEFASHAGEWLGPGPSSDTAQVVERALTPIFDLPRKVVEGEWPPRPPGEAVSPGGMGAFKATWERMEREAKERGEEPPPTLIPEDAFEKIGLWAKTTFRVGLELLMFKGLHTAVKGAKSKLKIKKRKTKITPEEYEKIAAEVREQAEVELDKQIRANEVKQREAKEKRVLDEALRERDRLQRLRDELPKAPKDEPVAEAPPKPAVEEPAAPPAAPPAAEAAPTPVFSHWKETFSTKNPYMAYYKYGDAVLPAFTLEGRGIKLPKPPVSPVEKAKVKPPEPKVVPKVEGVDDLTLGQLEIMSNLAGKPLGMRFDWNALQQHLFDKHGLKGQAIVDITVGEVKGLLAKEGAQKLLPSDRAMKKAAAEEPKAVEPKAVPEEEPTFGVEKPIEKEIVSMDDVRAEAEKIVRDSKNIDEVYNKMQELTTRYEEHPRAGFADEIEMGAYREWGDNIMGKINDARRKNGLPEADPTGPTTAVINDKRVTFTDPTESGGFETRKSAEIYKRAFADELGDIIENPHQPGRFVFEIPGEEPKPVFSDAQLNAFVPLDKVPELVRRFFNRPSVKTREVIRNRDLWKDTGFWYGRDGNWRYEISGQKATLRYPENKRVHIETGGYAAFKLGEVFEHPGLYELFPEMRDMTFTVSPAMTSKGKYNPHTGTVSIQFFKDKATLMHEIQHVINHKTGAYLGSNYDMLFEVYKREMPVEAASERAWREYSRHPGEMEARLSSMRSWMSDSRRAHEAPWETLDWMLELEGIPAKTGTKLYSGAGAFQDMYERFVGRMKERGAKGGKPLPREVSEVLDKGRIVLRRKIKGRYRPQVYEGEYNVLNNCEVIPQTFLHRAFEAPIRTFREAGGEALLDLTTHPYHAREKGALILSRALRKSRKELKQGTSSKMRENIMRYAVSKQEFGKEKLEFMGRGMLKELSPKEMEVYEALRARYESWYHRLNNVRKAIGKDPFPKTEDYFTFIRNLSWLERAGFEPLQMPIDILNAQFVKMGSTPFPFEKPRSRTAYRLEMDPFHVLEIYENTAARYVQMSPLVAKLREYQARMVDPETGQKFQLVKKNPVLAASLQSWTNAIAGMKSPSFRLPMGIEKAMTRVNNNLVASILGANARSAMIQVTALRNTVAEIGPAYTTRGILSLVDPKARNFAMQKSKVLSQRTIDIAVEDALRHIRAGRIGEAQRFGTRLAMKPLQILDLETAKATWQGAYEYAVNKKGLTGKRAVTFADDVVTRTQASGMIGDLAPVQRPVVGRFLTLFQTFTINDWDFLIKDVLGKRNVGINSRAAFVKTMRYVAATTLFNILLEDVLHIQSPFPTPIKAFIESLENEDEFPSLAINVGKELIEPIPMVGAARYGKGPFGPGGELIQESVKFLSGDTDARAWWELGGKWGGVPGTAQVGKTTRARTRGESPWGQVVGTYTPPEGSLSGLEGMEGLGGLSP